MKDTYLEDRIQNKRDSSDHPAPFDSFWERIRVLPLPPFRDGKEFSDDCGK